MVLIFKKKAINICGIDFQKKKDNAVEVAFLQV
jgi:hypothetical protein